MVSHVYRANKAETIGSFNTIANHADESWDHNNHYHDSLLRHLPLNRWRALDVGSGLGQLSRLLSTHFSEVQGIDFSPTMVHCATKRAAAIPNVRFICADFMEQEYPDCCFDCVVSVATLHHLPYCDALRKLKRILKPGGALLLLDLYRAGNALDLAFSAIGVVADRLARLFRKSLVPKELAEAWHQHSRLDHYQSIAEIRRACADILPQARIRRHIYFRYSLVWRKT